MNHTLTYHSITRGTYRHWVTCTCGFASVRFERMYQAELVAEAHLEEAGVPA